MNNNNNNNNNNECTEVRYPRSNLHDTQLS